MVLFFSFSIPQIYDAFEAKLLEEGRFVKNDQVLLQAELRIVATPAYERLLTSPVQMRQQDESKAQQQLQHDLFQLLEHPVHADVTIEVEGERIASHKAILALRSPVFAAMFEMKMQEHASSIVKIDDLSAKTFKQMMTFIYSGVVQANTWEEAQELLYAAEKYSLPALKSICEYVMEEHLTPDNVVPTLRLIELFGLSAKLRAACKRVFAQQLDQTLVSLCSQLVEGEGNKKNNKRSREKDSASASAPAATASDGQLGNEPPDLNGDFPPWKRSRTS